ncbi:hypothetical protein RHGRI_026969 [Rhododendron griersonianum]|uniref:Uncharacterized protein n=1 Tax=Rhododendron griersonianum TaxID=479676 RepID=A0AAV6IVA3_9ERIC|nr:hypothetical protein RHGRI_026969 [Rhododendron griersonianum]
MMVQTKKKTVRTVEQCESSASMTMSEEMQRTTITMQMKIEAMQKGIDAVRMTNGGKMNRNYLWILVFCVLSYMCGKSSSSSSSSSRVVVVVVINCPLFVM